LDPIGFVTAEPVDGTETASPETTSPETTLPETTTVSPAPTDEVTVVAIAASGPSAKAVPTAVDAGLVSAPVMNDHDGLGRLMTLLGGLLAAVGAMIALAGRSRGAHQL